MFGTTGIHRRYVSKYVCIFVRGFGTSGLHRRIVSKYAFLFYTKKYINLPAMRARLGLSIDTTGTWMLPNKISDSVAPSSKSVSISEL